MCVYVHASTIFTLKLHLHNLKPSEEKYAYFTCHGQPDLRK